jgi:hypothetical protein
MIILFLFEILGDILSLYFMIIALTQDFLSNFPRLKYIIPANWHKSIKFYIFTGRELQEVGCKNISIKAEKVDSNSKSSYQIPFKLCIPKGKGELKKFKGATITFLASDENQVHIMGYEGSDLGDVININESALEQAYQGMYFLILSRNYYGVDVQINVVSKVIKKSGKTSKVTKPVIIIDGLEGLGSNSIELKTYQSAK